MLALSRIIEQIKIIKSEVSKIYGEKKYHTQALNVAKTSSHVPSRVIGTTTDEVVGFKDEIEKILGYLVGDQKQLDVVSIVGMAGLGKTTLAKKMYEDPSITERFHIRAWCTISQTYQRRELLLTILKGVIKVTDGISKLTDDELAAKLSQSLRGRKYLIVLDDIWEIKAWNHLVRSFPDDNNQSRILITSRLQNVASQTKAGSKVHLLRDFSDDETWELFQKKLFEKESFSRGFLKVGEQIAQKCSRLPLAIVVIAGLLATVEKSVHKWEEIATNLSSHIFSDSKSQFKDILELSYNHLPGHLRSCFLYFAVFAEDQEIPVQKLKWLWIAEGFVRNTEAKSLEDVAEEYFMDLINRSLVITTKERSFGGVKACCLHDLLRDFCLEKVEEESFLQVLHVYNELKVLEVYDQRRLIIYSRAIDPLEAWPSGYSVRTLLHTSASKYAVYLDQVMYKNYNVSFIFEKFKLLRVMDIACINLRKYFGGIELMIHLRYLAIKIETKSIPSSIAKLWNLRTFLVKANRLHTSREVINVPYSLWDIESLRNVHINHRAIFRVGHRRPENLETLSTPCFYRTGDAETFLRRLPKLQKLKCIFVDCWQLPELDFLNQLMSLKVSFKGSSSFSGSKGKLNFPQNLQKLTLSNFELLQKILFPTLSN